MNNWPRRGDIYWINLDPTVGSEINKKRPCLVVSNDAGNQVSSRVIVAPITSSAHKVYPFEVLLEMQKVRGKILLDQIRSIDKSRLLNKIASIEKVVITQVDKALKIALALI